MSITKNMGVVCLIFCFLSCTKEFRTENQLKKDTGKWNIILSEWHVISVQDSINIDSSGIALFPGYFEFDKKKQGSWLCQTDSLFGFYMAFGSSFDWFADKETIYINSHSTEPENLADHPLIHETWTSFTGEIQEDKTILTLDGYSNRQFSNGNYITLFARFFLQKE